MDRGRGRLQGKEPWNFVGKQKRTRKKKEGKGNVGNSKRSKFDRPAVRIQLRAQLDRKLRA